MKRSKRENAERKSHVELSFFLFFFLPDGEFFVALEGSLLEREGGEKGGRRGSRFPIVAKSTSKYLRRNLVTTAASGKARKIHSTATLVAAATARKTRFRPFDVPWTGWNANTGGGVERPTVKNGPDMVASKISRAENFLLREERNSLTSSRTNEPAPRFVWFDRGELIGRMGWNFRKCKFLKANTCLSN